MPNGDSLDCDGALRQLWDYLDQELTDENMVAVRKHLRLCADCFPHAELGERFLAAIRQTRELRPMPASVRMRVTELLHKEQSGQA